MGRGKHAHHIEKKIQVNIKFKLSILTLLLENKIINDEYTANKYVNSLVERDLDERGIIEL